MVMLIMIGRILRLFRAMLIYFYRLLKPTLPLQEPTRNLPSADSFVYAASAAPILTSVNRHFTFEVNDTLFSASRNEGIFWAGHNSLFECWSHSKDPKNSYGSGCSQWAWWYGFARFWPAPIKRWLRELFRCERVRELANYFPLWKWRCRRCWIDRLPLGRKQWWVCTIQHTPVNW